MDRRAVGLGEHLLVEIDRTGRHTLASERLGDRPSASADLYEARDTGVEEALGEARVDVLDDEAVLVDALEGSETFFVGMDVAIGARARRTTHGGLTTTAGDRSDADYGCCAAPIEAATGERVVGEPDLAPAHERWLGEWAVAQHGSDFLFVEGYPMVKRPFYTHPDPDRPEFSNSFDLLFRGLELVTGGQRQHRYADYIEVMDEPACVVLDGYLEAFRHGMPPHGGFAIGLERWTRPSGRRTERSPGHAVPTRHPPAVAIEAMRVVFVDAPPEELAPQRRSNTPSAEGCP